MRSWRGEKERGKQKEEREKIFDINNALREDVSRVTYHYRVFGIQIPGSKNPLLILYSEDAFNIHIGEGVIYLQIYRARSRLQGDDANLPSLSAELMSVIQGRR